MIQLQGFRKVFWFIAGLAMGITLISLGHAAIPSRATPQVTEIKSKPVLAPDLEQDYARLSQAESKYAESWNQQQKIKSATQRVAKNDYKSKSKLQMKKSSRK